MGSQTVDHLLVVLHPHIKFFNVCGCVSVFRLLCFSGKGRSKKVMEQ